MRERMSQVTTYITVGKPLEVWKLVPLPPDPSEELIEGAYYEIKVKLRDRLDEVKARQVLEVLKNELPKKIPSLKIHYIEVPVGGDEVRIQAEALAATPVTFASSVIAGLLLALGLLILAIAFFIMILKLRSEDIALMFVVTMVTLGALVGSYMYLKAKGRI